MSNQDTALSLARAGFAIFPCGQDKKPLIGAWRENSTTDETTIQNWWQGQRGALPIDCGKSGLVVIDCDRHKDQPDGVKAFSKLCKQNKQSLNDLLIVKTPSGGRHIYFRQPSGQVPFGNGRGNLPPGVDVRGNGGYVIAVGAELADGRKYESKKSLTDINGELPTWSAEILRPVEKPSPTPKFEDKPGGEREQAYAAAALDNIAGELASAAPGTRNEQVNKSAFRLGTMCARGWIDRSKIEIKLTEAAEACGLIKDDGRRAVAKTIESGITAGMRSPHNDLDDRSKQNEDEKPPKVDPAELIKAFTFLGDARPSPPRMLIKGLLPAEGIAVTGGQSTAGKTFLEIHKAICLARPLAFFGHKIVERVGTAFVAAEGRALIPNRFAAALAKHSITDELPIAWINQLPDFASPAGIKLFIQQLKALNKKFEDDFGVRLGQVTIDTVAACFAMKDEDDNAEAQKVCNTLRTIGDELGVLMCPVHHYGKNPESGLRGASQWKGSSDIVQGVLADIDLLTGRTSNREFVCVKARDGEQGPISPFELQFVELGLDDDREIYGACCVVPTEGKSRFDKTAALSKRQRAIQEAINEALDGLAKVITPRPGMPPVKAVKVPDVRTEFDRRYVVDADDANKAAEAKRKAFKRALDHLSPTQFGAGSAEGADWIWKIG